MTKNARTCESCHASSKALGLGIGSTRPWNKEHFVDLETVDGKILSKNAQPQMAAIENLDHDWSQIVDKDGKQLATVGHHFQLSRAFNKPELEHMSREGTCIACHKEIPANSTAINLLHHVAKYTGKIPKTADQHNSLLHKITLLAAWTQVIAPLALILAGASWYAVRRSKRAKMTL
jgi:hypothetical protein